KRDSSDNWQVFFDPELGWRIVNVPYGSKREQHVLNLRSGGACKFNIESNVWARYKGELYFGGKDATVYRIREGDDNGSAISWAVQQAFTDFGLVTEKGVVNYRPRWETLGSFEMGSGLAYDYDTRQFIQTGSFTTQG